MGDDLLHYDRMVQTALRGVVREALAQVAEHGLPSGHHFLITFRTDHPEAQLPDHIRAQHPVEMTIVLQHQFWGLEVGEESFSVTLSFRKVHERITVPFTALTRFVDPPVNFGLQTVATDAEGRPLPPAPGEEAPAESAEGAEGEAGATGEKKKEPAQAQEKVVALDAFRRGK